MDATLPPAVEAPVEPIRVIVVDDDDAVRAALVSLLRHHGGFEVVAEAADGGPAPALVGRLRPELVVIDLRMPVVGGIEALPLIFEADADVRVVMLSAYSDEALVADALAAGAFSYLIKGCPASQLFETLERAWRSRRTGSEASGG